MTVGWAQSLTRCALAPHLGCNPAGVRDPMESEVRHSKTSRKRRDDLARWPLGLPLFEAFYAILILTAVLVALAIPLVQWLRELLR